MSISSAELRRFSDARARLNEQSDALRTQIDTWLAENGSQEPAMTALATLSGLLEMRRDLLAGLAELDDRFLTQLIHLRGAPPG